MVQVRRGQDAFAMPLMGRGDALDGPAQGQNSDKYGWALPRGIAQAE